MVVDCVLIGLPLGSTCLVLTTWTSLVAWRVLIFVDLGRSVPEVQWISLAWIVRHHVPVVDHAPLGGPHFVWKSGVCVIANSRLTEVYHLGDSKTILDECHASQLRHSTAQTVSGQPYLCIFVNTLKSFDLCNYLSWNRVGSSLKTSVNKATAVFPWVPGLCGVKVSNPIFERWRASEDNVDRVVVWEEPDKALKIVSLVVEG